MKNPSANYTARNQLIHAPRFLLQFSTLPNQYASGEFSGRLSSQKMLLGTPELNLSEIQPLKPSARDLGSFRVRVMDEANEITAMISNNTVYGQVATLKALFDEITETDALSIANGRVVNYKASNDFQSYDFEISAIFPEIDKTIFTSLSEDKTNGQFASYFAEANTTNAPVAGVDIWVQIDRNLEGIRTGDVVYFQDASIPTTQEIAIVKQTRVNTANLNLDIKVDLVNSYTVGSTLSLKYLRVANASQFPTTVPANPPFVDGLHLQLGREIIKYSAIDAVLNTLTVSSRNLYLSAREGHSDGQAVKECWVLRQDPITLMLNALTTTAAGSNGSYDLGVAGFGAGMDENLIDIPTAENIRSTYFLNDEFRYIMSESMNCHDFCRDIWQATGIFPVITSTGLLSFKKVQNLTPALAVDNIIDDDIYITESQEEQTSLPFRYAPGIDKLINEVEYRYDWVPGRNEYVTSRVFELSASKTEFNLTRRLVIQSKGMRSNLGTGNIITPYLDALAKKYGNPPPRLEFDLLYKKHLVDAGDVVSLTSALFPNMKTGSRDLSGELMEVVKSELDPASNKVRFAGYLHNQVRRVNIGSVDSVSPSDPVADFDATDSALVQSVDATYDNSAGINISSDKITVRVLIVYTLPLGNGLQIIKYHIRVGTDVHLATMVVEDELDYTHSWKSESVEEGSIINTHVFNFGSSAVRDVKLDFYSKSGNGTVGITKITLPEIIYENNGAVYTEMV